jgi:hypothetical protein
MLAGGQREIYAERDRKLEVARKLRQVRRQQAASYTLGPLYEKPTFEEVAAADVYGGS